MGILEQLDARRTAMTAKELAILLHWSRAQLYKQTEAGVVPSFLLVGDIRYCPLQVAAWLRECQRG
jgi:hypothetical protein